MNTSDLLESLLRSGQASTTQQGDAAPEPQSGSEGGLGGLLGGLLGGAGASIGSSGLGGLLGGLLGGTSTGATTQERPGGTNYAALASLGMMAFQAYQTWQQQQASAPQQALSTIDQLSGPEAEDHSHAILCALIGAAKADGTIDDREKQLIAGEMGRHTDDPQLQQWLDQELASPLSAADVAQSAKDPGMAAEMYLASVMMVGDQQGSGRSYLDELAAQLKIDPQLQQHLEQQAKSGATG